MPRLKKPKLLAATHFNNECVRFSGLIEHASRISNKIGVRTVDPRRGYATWLFVRGVVSAVSMKQLFVPVGTSYPGTRLLDYASLAALSRCMIDTMTALVYISDIELSEADWTLRKHIIDLHDNINRSDFLDLIGHTPRDDRPDDRALKDRVRNNPIFSALPKHRRSQLLDGKDMFVEGRHQTMCRLGWGDALTRGVYKYLSHHSHALSLSFHRTVSNRLLEEGSEAAMGVSSFAIEFARKALGSGCLQMIRLFPEVELEFDPLIISALATEYKYPLPASVSELGASE